MKHWLSGIRSKRVTLAIVAGAAVALVLSTSLALGAGHIQFHPFTSVSYTDNTNAPVVQGVQNGTGPGVEGVVGNTAGAIGILGDATSTSNAEVGLEGLVHAPGSTGLYGQALATTGSPSVGLLGTSTTGTGVEGESITSTGIGVFGTSQDATRIGELGVNGGAGVLGTSGSGAFEEPGVDGEVTACSIFCSAATFGQNYSIGASTTPFYGVVGYASNFGVQGLTVNPGSSSSNPGYGVEGQDFLEAGQPDYNAGVVGVSTFGTGLLGEGNGNTPSRIGRFDAGAYIVGGANSTTGYGVGLEVESADTKTDTVFAFNPNGRVALMPQGGTLLIHGFGNSLNGFSIDTSGNEILSGTLTTSGSPFIVTRGNSGSRMASYGARSTVPNIEDFGEAQLTAGQSYVRIDAQLADAMDHRANYLVFITPEGDSNGLYVTNKSVYGFAVRENQSGHHTLAFSYRIVAKPADQTGGRLALLPANFLRVRPSPQDFMPRHTMPRPLTPQQELAVRFGPARAAQMLADYRARVLARRAMEAKLPRVDLNGNLHLNRVVVPPVTHP